MSSQTTTGRARTTIPDERLAEAGVWIARLHGDGRGPEVRNGLRQWLSEDPLNARAYELVTDVWDDAEQLRRVVPLAAAARSRQAPRFFYFGTAVAALIATVVVGVTLYMRGDIVATGIGEQRQVTLTDGTRIFLNTATRVVVNYADEARRVDVTKGEALFDVAKRPDWPFIVTAGERHVTALGTSFVVRKDQKNLVVTLVEGKVSVDPVKAAPSVTGSSAPAVPQSKPGTYTLTAGQRLTFAEGTPPKIDTPSIEESMAWRRGQVVMNEMLLSAAAAEMNRYNNRQVITVQPEVAELSINGLFQAGDSASFANAVAQAYGLQMTQGQGQIVLSGPRNN